MSKIKYYRNKAGLTARQLAEKTEIPVRTIENYELRPYRVARGNFANLLRIARVLGVEPEQLIEKEEGN